MRALLTSLYGRISAIFLVLLLVFSLVQLLVGVQSARHFAQESDQSLNRHLAADLAKTFQPAMRDGLNRGAVSALIHEMMVYNPRVEIYVLDAHGRILDYFADGARVERKAVDMAPVRAFLAGGKSLPLPIRGDDPRSLDKRKPFSAAPIRIGNEPGYLYLILGGEKYDSIAGMVEESYIIRNSIISLIVTFFSIAVAGLVIFFLLTRRLRTMVGAMHAFEVGNYAARAPEKPADEIGQLGKAFNDMADRVVTNLEQIRSADALRRELVANVSHDLRSPLSSVQGYLETILMKGPALSQQEQRHFLEIIHGNVTRLGTLVGELFELSKLEARQIELQPEPFSLSELVQDVLLKFKPRALEQHIRLECAYPTDLPFVFGDIGMIERVLVNLIDNALRYTPREGEVRVSLEPSSQAVWVRVSDTGSGIAAEDLPHVFDRFYRADKARSRFSGGTGIGLAIAKRILEAHRSEIGVRSTPGAGTTFTFHLAIHRPAPARSPELSET